MAARQQHNMRKLKGQIWKCELNFCVAILLLNTHSASSELPDICPVLTLSTTHHRLLPIRAGNVALLLEYTQCASSELPADRDSCPFGSGHCEPPTGQSLYETLHLRRSCRCWHYENLLRSCPPQIVIPKMSTTTTTALLT